LANTNPKQPKGQLLLEIELDFIILASLRPPKKVNDAEPFSPTAAFD
jgi:hypothetical protein